MVDSYVRGASGVSTWPSILSRYINDIVEDLQNDIKLFPDDTSIFSVVKDKDEAAIRTWRE